ncbi:MAG: DUF2141 domain-containing protein [Sphingobacteriaceae bacterium]|nr:DUF2141 domain-containing protein [Sphingobacteriaceae bacterium]
MFITWLFIALFGNVFPAEVHHELVIRVTNIQNTTGLPLLIGVYKSTDGFPGFHKSSYHKKVIARSSEITVTFKLPPGEYAVGLMHDINENGQIDKNWVGYPTEPFGFSRNFKPKLGPPSFNDCKIDLNKGNQRIEIKLL